jgi:hypothetical protein
MLGWTPEPKHRWGALPLDEPLGSLSGSSEVDSARLGLTRAATAGFSPASDDPESDTEEIYFCPKCQRRTDWPGKCWRCYL